MPQIEFGYGDTILLFANGSITAIGNPFINSASTIVSTAPLTLSSTIVFAGDSITFNDGWDGYARWAMTFAGGKYFPNPITNVGTTLQAGWIDAHTGDTTTDLIAKLPTIAAQNPKVVVVLIGTNDIGTSANPTATIISNLQTIYAAIPAEYVPVTILPRGSGGWSSAMEQSRLDVNAWIIANKQNVVVSSNFITSASTVFLQDDLTHPGPLGAQVLGQGVGTQLLTMISTARILDATTPNLLANPNFANSSNTSSGWTWFPNASNGLTHSTSATTIGSDVAQCIQGNGTSTGGVADILSQTITGLAAGTYEAWMEIQIDSMIGLNGLAMCSNRSSNAMFSITAQATGGLCNVPWTGVVRSPPTSVASSTVSIQPALSILPASGFTGVNYQIRVAAANLRLIQ